MIDMVKECKFKIGDLVVGKYTAFDSCINICRVTDIEYRLTTRGNTPLDDELFPFICFGVFNLKFFDTRSCY